MAPVESDYFSSNNLPLLLLFGKIAIVDLLLVQVITYCKRASKVLPPSQTTRVRAETRKKNVSTFAWLAIASLVVTAYHGVTALVYSYDAWAKEHDEATPGALWDGWYAGDDDTTWQLGKWWREIDLTKEFAQPALGTSKGLWWTQQLLVARLAFAAFMGIEGHRRDISKKTIVSLLLLAQLSGLSVAQSLFFIILLLTPVPARPAQSQSHARWNPHPAVYIVSVLFSTACVVAMPTLASNGLGWAALAGDFANQLFLATAIRFVPKSWGKEHSDISSAHEASASIYRGIALTSFGLFIKRTFWAALLNSGDTYQRRFDFVWTTHANQRRSTLEKLLTASMRILGAVNEDPVVGNIGWDVLLSGFALCTWAAMRGLDVSKMLKSITPWSTKQQRVNHKRVAFSPDVKREKSETPASEVPDPPEGKRGRGRPRKSAAPAPAAAPATPAPSTGRVLRRRTELETPRRDESDSEDALYVPPAATAAEIANTEREEERDDDLTDDAEAAALAWGLSLVGGLGLMSSAVMGAELRSR